MLYEPTTLASLVGLLATSLREEYGIDPAPIYSQAGVPLAPPGVPAASLPSRQNPQIVGARQRSVR